MKTLFMSVGVVFLLTLVARPSAALAATEVYFHSGNCANGGIWWSVSTYMEGTLVEVTGVDCFGNFYRKTGGSTLSAPPVGILGDWDSGVCSATASWTGRIIYDANHAAIGALGTSCSGSYIRDLNDITNTVTVTPLRDATPVDRTPMQNRPQQLQK